MLNKSSSGPGRNRLDNSAGRGRIQQGINGEGDASRSPLIIVVEEDVELGVGDA
jgi:hypothetical protein